MVIGKLDAMNRDWQTNAEYYVKHLDVFGLKAPTTRTGCTNVFNQYVTEVTDAFCPVLDDASGRVSVHDIGATFYGGLVLCL